MSSHCKLPAIELCSMTITPSNCHSFRARIHCRGAAAAPAAVAYRTLAGEAPLARRPRTLVAPARETGAVLRISTRRSSSPRTMRRAKSRPRDAAPSCVSRKPTRSVSRTARALPPRSNAACRTCSSRRVIACRSSSAPSSGDISRPATSCSPRAAPRSPTSTATSSTT